MTEEENKAIEYFKTYNWYADINTQHKNVDILLNLIEKLKKENEDLRVQGSIVYLDYKILKDKIKELFKELYIVEETKFAKIKTTDNDKLFKFAKDIQKLLEEE